MTVEIDLLDRAAIPAPDGRPLFSYACTDGERERLARDLSLRLDVNPTHPVTARRFVLWAAEAIRAHLPPGGLTWEWLFDRLGREADGGLGRELAGDGLEWWAREVRLTEGGNRQFLYSLMAEGGLPDAYLAEAARYRDTVLAMLSEIEAEGTLGPAAAERVARRRVADLPQAFRHEDTALLLADLALALAGARARLPADLPTEATEAWLDAQVPSWKESLPLRLSAAAIEALIRPALRAARGKAARPPGPICRRELRRRTDGTGWASYAVVGDGAHLAARFLEGVDPRLRLRLLAPAAASGPAPSFLGVPEEGGWRLTRVGGTTEAAVRIAPDRPLVLTAHCDGRPMGEAVVDPGLPPPEDAPGFWRARDPCEHMPTRLESLTGSARTRGPQLWLLATLESEPEAGDGVTIGLPEPGPGGRLWPVAGCGTVAVAGQVMRIATGVETEAPSHRLHVFGHVLPGWRSDDDRMVFVGQPEFWGAESTGAMHRLRTGTTTGPVLRRLGGFLAEWRIGGEVVARATFIVLPAETRLRLAEVGPGTVQVESEGLVGGWNMHLTSLGAETAARVAPGGSARLGLSVGGHAPAALRLRLSDPATGAALVLAAPWPARRGMIVAPDGTRLARDRSLAVGALDGWHAIVPAGQSGTLQLRFGPAGPRIGLSVGGEVRLAASEQLVRTMLSLGGLDAEVRLQLIVSGDEGHRLTLRRYEDDARFVNGSFAGGALTWRLHAVALDPPGETREIDGVSGDVDLAAWLGDTAGLWLIQARSRDGGVARPMAWAATPRLFSTREGRIAGYAAAMHDLLDAPSDPAWEVCWRLLRAAREGGDAGALDQVQALGHVPGFAIALLFRVTEVELAEALALEDATPIWWPVSPISAWTEGVASDLARRRDALLSAGFDRAAAQRMSGEAIARRAGAILTIRPELQGHLGAGLHASNLAAVALAAHLPGGAMPLAIPRAAERLDALKQEASRRDTPVPEGTAALRLARHSRAAGMPDHLRALLDAPLVAAEIAAGGATRTGLETLLQLIALRQADPIWFDAALPAAVQLAAQEISHD